MADVSIGTQCASFEPFWRAHRDNWRPVTPDDVHGLAEDRTFQPPSKAHVKRIRRFRPVVTPAEPRVVDANGARADVNRRIKASREVLAACGCLPKPHTTIPLAEAMAKIRNR